MPDEPMERLMNATELQLESSLEISCNDKVNNNDDDNSIQ